jgi:hypothetical protein
MSVAICLEVETATEDTIAGAMELLVERNVAIYRAGLARAPWGLRWVPDELVACDDHGCKVARVTMQQDAIVIERNGQGSCGSLACAYAAWLIVGGVDAGIDLWPNGAGKYHLIAKDRERTYDPQQIGAQ